ncbi:KilA, N- domain-containing protein, partial [Achromatium sp. WMS1]
MQLPIIIEEIAIRQDAQGRFCLNDLHKASGGAKRHQPSNWLS